MGTMPGAGPRTRQRPAGPGPPGWPSQALSSPFNPPTHHVRERSDPPFCLLRRLQSPPQSRLGAIEVGAGLDAPTNPGMMPRLMTADTAPRMTRPTDRPWHDRWRGWAAAGGVR